MENSITLKTGLTRLQREKPIIGQLSFTDEDVRNSEVLKRQIENAKRRLKEIHFPTESYKLI